MFYVLDEQRHGFVHLKLKLTATVIEREIMSAPFTELYVVVIDGSNKRVYNKIGPARARVTSCIEKSTDRFRSNVELWSVGDNGWRIDFSAQKGDHHSKITWQTAIEANKRREERYAQEAKDRDIAKKRAEYEQLRKMFENN